MSPWSEAAAPGRRAFALLLSSISLALVLLKLVLLLFVELADRVDWRSELDRFWELSELDSIFLKYILFQCIEGKFKANLVPIYLSLKDFSESLIDNNTGKFIHKFDLIDYIRK